MSNAFGTISNALRHDFEGSGHRRGRFHEVPTILGAAFDGRPVLAYMTRYVPSWLTRR